MALSDMDPSWIAAAFSAFNSIRVVFYVPQIVAVARSRDGARDIALSTWLMWVLTNASGTAYGVWVVRDGWLALSFGLCTAACVVTVALAVVKRWRLAVAQRRPGAEGTAISSP